jgi:hypothetical protein
VWLFAKFRESDDQGWQTILGRFCVQEIQDFCGGVYFFSPQVVSDKPDVWAMPGNFANAGVANPPINWDSLGDDDTVPSLNDILGMTRILPKQARDWMKKQIALNLVGFCMASEKRSIQCADIVGGQVEDIISLLPEVSQTMAPFGGPCHVLGIIGRKQGENVPHLPVYQFEPSMETLEWDFHVTETDTFENYSSDHECISFNVVLEYPHNGDDPMDDDDLGACQVPPAILTSYRRKDYLALMSRHLWSNG